MIQDIARYVRVLEGGGVVACPTETLVGLLADALRQDAVERVVRIKGRAPDAPIAVLLPDVAAWDRVARDVPPAARALASAHWPGPLTLVAWARPGLPAALVHDGKVGARVPGPSPALELVRAFGGPLTATSANRSGEPPARDAAQAARVLGDRLDAVVPGVAPGGRASTVLDVTADPPRVLRAGAVAISQ
ncbi:MAG: L-threonylcarbamoyladenylate synthase [Myxococcota bacterium]